MRKTFTFIIMCMIAMASLNAQTVNNLYVSPTGWAMWDELDNASSYQVYLATSPSTP